MLTLLARFFPLFIFKINIDVIETHFFKSLFSIDLNSTSQHGQFITDNVAGASPCATAEPGDPRSCYIHQRKFVATIDEVTYYDSSVAAPSPDLSFGVQVRFYS